MSPKRIPYSNSKHEIDPEMVKKREEEEEEGTFSIRAE